MKNLLTISLLSLAFSSEFALAQQTCYRRAEEINRGIERDALTVDQINGSSRTVLRVATALKGAAYNVKQAAQQIPNLESELNSSIESSKSQILKNRQALHNVHSLLNDLKGRSDMSAQAIAIVENALSNNLVPAEQNAESAMSGLDSLKSRVASLNGKLKGSELSRSADQIYDSATRIESEVGITDRDSERVARDLRYAQRSIPELCR